MESGEIEELADILEVIYALSNAKGYSYNELMSVCEKKNNERGGFFKKIFLISKEKNDESSRNTD